MTKNQENLKIQPFSDDDMGKGYTSYIQAIKNRRSDEDTILDVKTELFYNVKSYFPRRLRWGKSK